MHLCKVSLSNLTAVLSVAASVQARMHVLAGFGPPAAAASSDNQKLDVMVANFTNAFCRRCRVFNCFSHKGPHTKYASRLKTSAPDCVSCANGFCLLRQVSSPCPVARVTS